MIENGFYILDTSYSDLVKQFNGEFDDPKSRPIYCCIEDRNISGLYWLIPTSDLSHRTPEQIQKFKDLAQVSDIRQAYYYIRHTTKPAIFKISKVLPVTDKYISHEYNMQGNHLIMQDQKQIEEIRKRLQRILSYEALHPNKLEQKITSVKTFLCEELKQEQELSKEQSQQEQKQPKDQPQSEISQPSYQMLYQENERRKQTIRTANAVLNSNPELKKEYIKAANELKAAQEKSAHERNITQIQCPSNPKRKR